MTLMNAAVVTSFDEPPHYQQIEVPSPRSGDEVLVDVVAAGLHPRVRSGAAGKHYMSSGKLPLIPGVDGVGRLADGTYLYFILDDDMVGSMAEQTVIDRRRAIQLPADADPVKIAAGMNPAMSSWVTLRQRLPLQRGQSVLVLGATGNAGTMAVQVAKRLGAGRVVAAGRDRDRLAALEAVGADETVQLTDDVEATGHALAAAAADIDVVIDYLWGPPAQRTIMALLTHRADRSRRLDWVQIGAVAEPTMGLPSVALRSANLRIQGTGQGSVPPAAYLAELPSLVEELDNGGILVEADSIPLAEIEKTWASPATSGRRVVVLPQGYLRP